MNNVRLKLHKYWKVKRYRAGKVDINDLREEQRVVIFLEPIALYFTKDLHQAHDNAWLTPYPDVTNQISYQEVGVIGDGQDVAIVTYGNGTFLSCQAQKIIDEKYGIKVRVIDLRWFVLRWSMHKNESIGLCSLVD